MQQQSLAPVQQQPVGQGQFAVRTSPFEYASKFAQALAAKRGQEKADIQQKELSQKIQSDYGQVLAKGLSQMQSDPAGALSTFMSHPMTAQTMGPLAVQDIQRQRLLQALGVQPQQPPSPMNPAGSNPSVMAGSGGQPYTPPQGQQPIGQGQPQAGGIPQKLGGLPTAAWFEIDPTGKLFAQHMAEGAKTSGRVFYDQNNDAYTVMGNGQVQRLPGISQGISPADRYKIGNELTNTYYNTGITPQPIGNPGQSQPRNPVQPGASPGGMPQPGMAPQPGALRPQANPGQPLTPKQKQELEAQRPHQTQAAQSSIAQVDNSLRELDRLDQQSGLANITGPIAGRTPNLTGAATNAQANLDTLKAQIGVHTLNAMREASKTGGAVGNVTEKEWPILQNQLGALQQSQTTAEFKRNLANVRASLVRIKEGIRQSYQTTYGNLPNLPGQSNQNDPLGLR